MHASMGARMPYRAAAFLLSGLLPRQRRCCPGTVRNHLSSAIGKTGTGTRVEAAAVARDRGWL